MSHYENQRPAAGSSLLETLIASAMLLIIAVAIFPMFHRAVDNNISGAESTQAAQHTRTEIEDLFTLPLDSDVFDMANPLVGHTVGSAGATGDEMSLGTFLFDPMANVGTGDLYDRSYPMAPGSWIVDENTAVGQIRWERTAIIRQYAYSDIAEGVIDASTGNQLVTKGHPLLFDSPLTKDAPDAQIHFREQEVSIESRRVGKPTYKAWFFRSM